jgi:hypothetical protein
MVPNGLEQEAVEKFDSGDPVFRRFIAESYNKYRQAKMIDPDIARKKRIDDYWQFKFILKYGPIATNTTVDPERERIVQDFIKAHEHIGYLSSSPDDAQIKLQRDPSFRQAVAESYDKYVNVKKVDPKVLDTAMQYWYYRFVRDFGPKVKNMAKMTVMNAENARENMEAYVQAFAPVQRYKPWSASTAFLIKDNPDASACVVFRDKSCIDDEYRCSMVWEDDDSKLSTGASFNTNLKGCLQNPNKKIVVIPMTLEGTRHAGSDRERHWAHSNFIIIRKNPGHTPVAQHFEPHGRESAAHNDWRMERQLKEYFQRFGVLYAPVYMMCPVGLQAIECSFDDRQCKDVRNDPGGYCAAWSFFFLQTALKFPDMWTDDITTLVGQVLNKDPKAFHKFIINYSQFLYKNIELMIYQEKIEQLGPAPKHQRRTFVRGTREGQRPSTIAATEKSLKGRTRSEKWRAWRDYSRIRREKRKRDPALYRRDMAKEFIESHKQDFREGDIIMEDAT